MTSQGVSDLRRRYSDDGYVVLKNVFTEQSLSMLGESLRSVLNKPEHADSHSEQTGSLDELIMKREEQDHERVYKAAQSVGSAASTYNLLGSSKILELVAECTGFEMPNLHLMPLYLIIQPPSDERFDYCWHQDGAYYEWCQDLMALWFPVNRGTKRDTGTISIIPGSHRDGTRETEVFLRHGFFKQRQSQLKDGEIDQERAIEVDRGDCCIMHGHAVHRSVANRSQSPRVAGVLRVANLGSQKSYERERFYCVHKS
jgi:ectoine hydroxylase-related dioxygenase (phytanoyl-CoA dioxygenase family)